MMTSEWGQECQDGFYLDLDGERLWRGDEVITLTPKAFAMLHYLAGRPQQLLDKETILDGVWPDSYVTEDGIKHYIQELRRALDDDAAAPRFIETVRGRGYRFVGPITFGAPPKITASETDPLPPAQTPPSMVRLSLRRRWLLPAGLVLTLVVIAGVVLWQLSRPPALPERQSDRITGEKPRIVVLPFDNISGDETQDYFAEGLAADLITHLSQVSGLFVVAPAAVFAYRSSGTDPRQVARELDTRYLLRGSVQKTSLRVRINVQLVDTRHGEYIWSERYDRNLSDVFATQDDVVGKIVDALAVQLTEQEKTTLAQRDTTNFEAYDDFLRGQRWVHTADIIRARSAYRRAIRRDPNFARAYSGLSVTYSYAVLSGWTDTPQQDSRQALQLARTAVGLVADQPQIQWALGMALLFNREFAAAITAAEKILALDPAHADGYSLLAMIHTHIGQPEKAIALVDKAFDLNPFGNTGTLAVLGQACYFTGQYERGIAALQDGLERNPEAMMANLYLVASYSGAGRIDDAEWQTLEILNFNRTFSLAHWAEGQPYKDPAQLDRLLADLRYAGLH